VAELGDKTRLENVTLAASYSWLAVWIGSSPGMARSDGLAIGVGQVLGKKLPERAIKIGAAVTFFAFGFYYAVKSANELWQIVPGLKALWG
jgi:Ca2+/H+ antiporter, TMEM165/GDT1 family